MSQDLRKAISDGSRTQVSFNEAFATYTDEQKEAVVLSRFDGFRYDQIAVMMGLSTEAVNQAVSSPRDAPS